jgi:predicted anti-sigma-YlaC factor YlaD
MDGHFEIRELLTLAAAGALDNGEQRRVEEHLRHCRDCRVELAVWQQLTGALEALPTPQAPLGLVERTRQQMARQAAARDEQRHTRNRLVWLTVFAWVSTLMSWLGFRWMGERLAFALGVSFVALAVAWVFYTLAAWLATALAAAVLGRRYREGGQYDPVF